jgi:uncharacterized protein (UPF0303 family)
VTPTPTLDELAAQETELQFDGFDHETALALGLHLVEAARRDRLPVAVTVRRGGQVMLHAGLPGSTPDNDGWLDRKCRVVERFHRSSLRLKVSHTDPAVPVEQAYRLDRTVYAADGGAFPITVRGTGVVGAIAVSGLPDVEDHAFVVRELRAFLSGRSGPAPG